MSLSVAFLEVYNEAVRDLLVRDSGALEVSGIPAGQLPKGATAALVHQRCCLCATAVCTADCNGSSLSWQLAALQAPCASRA